jgi:hypothetical protein
MEEETEQKAEGKASETKEKVSDEEKMEKAIKKVIYHIAAGSIMLVEGNSEEQKKIIKDVIRRIRGNWKAVYVSQKHKERELENFLLRSNGFFKGRIFRIMPRDRILIIENADAISERNLKMIRYFYDENNLKSVVMITQDASIINEFPDAMKNRIGNRIIRLEK